MISKGLIYCFLLLSLGVTAQTATNDTIVQSPSATISPADSSQALRWQEPLVTTKIKLLARSYGDSIVLRWMPEDYVSWKYLTYHGVNVLRINVDEPGFEVDTVAYALKPLTEEQFRAKYAENDSNALLAQGVLYGEGRLDYAQTKDKPGTFSAGMEYNSEQDISYAFAMLVAEWRKDLARDLAVGIVDHNVKPGARYQYIVQPTVWENGGILLFEPGFIEYMVNNPYEAPEYDIALQDSLISPRKINIYWYDDKHSSFEIERREKGQTEWQRITDKPFITMLGEDDVYGYNVYNDSVPAFGLYEYRVMAHDPFGDLTSPSKVHETNIYDNEPPTAPNLKYIQVYRPEDGDLMAKVMAKIVWEKDVIEEDLNGYIINYFNEQVTGKQWIALNDDLISPNDTTCTLDVTHLTTGAICMTAVDNSGNEGRSLIQMIRLTDYKAPDIPDSLRATVSADGNILIEWNPCADDDIAYYDLAFANDTTHTFLQLNEGGIPDTWYTDSLALNVNQKYIYYKVRAVDYSSNMGLWSPWIQVKRPHITPPTQPHLDRSGHSDAEGMHMEWIVGTDADMDYHVAYRGLSQDGPWEVIGRYDADSLRACGYRITIDDNPPYDRENRYYYYVESFNSSPFTSKSLAVSWLHAGPKVVKAGIELAGDYDERSQLTKLAWTTGRLPIDAPYYYCVYRKGPGEDKFKFMISVASDKAEYADNLLGKGETAQYYVMIQWRDGRQSALSNTVTVSRRP
ncbi:MAG: hypothetical protein IJ176_01335 [Prevotella sp.]|nr:hypothetical protein [Prevotella sp.]